MGPLNIYSFITREQVKKSEKTMEGGTESGTPTSINDYNFITDRYFFIDNNFKNSYYPLNQTNNHIYNSDYVIGEFELYQKVTNSENAAMIQADAFLFPLDTTSYSVGGSWIKLEENVDYTIDRLLGYIRLNSVQNAIAIAYTTTSFDANKIDALPVHGLEQFNNRKSSVNFLEFITSFIVHVFFDNAFGFSCACL